MKALSSRRKRGRPPLPVSEREPNGKLSRRQNSVDNRNMENNMNVAVSTRIRHLGLVDTKTETAIKQATDPRRGYVLGLMLLDGTVTQAQHDGGELYAEDMARFYGLTGIPFPTARAQDLFALRGSGGEDSQSRADAAKKARLKANELQALLLGRGDINTARNVERAVKGVTLMDISEARNWPPHMLLWLRKGLNLLANYYGRG